MYNQTGETWTLNYHSQSDHPEPLGHQSANWQYITTKFINKLVVLN